MLELWLAGISVVLTIIGFLVALVKSLLLLNKTLVTLNISVKSLGEDMRCLKTDNKASHKEIHEKLNDHEFRLDLIEQKEPI